jgi:phage gp46-like protein
MTDLALQQTPKSGLFDIVFDGVDLVTDDTLRPALILSLFTNRRADADDVVPADDPTNPGGADRGGWWGDWYSPAMLAQLKAIAANDNLRPPVERMGSKLWLVGSVLGGDAERIAFAKRAVEQAVQWVIDAGIATAMNVDVALPGDGVLAIAIQAVRPSGLEIHKFDYRWGV